MAHHNLQISNKKNRRYSIGTPLLNANDVKCSANDVQMLRQLNNTLSQQLVRSYIENPLIISTEVTQHNIKMRTVTGQQQINLNKELSQHTVRLKQWNDDLTYLEKKFKDYAQMNQLKEEILGIKETNDKQHGEDEEDENDEKKEEKMDELSVFNDTDWDEYDKKNVKTMRNDDYYEFNSAILLRQYTNCTNLLNGQEARSETVDEYIVPLNETKSKLRRIVKEYENDVNSLQTKHDEIDSKYQKILQKRVSLQENIKNLMKSLNRAIDEENKLNRQQVNTLNDLNVLKLEQNEYEKILQKSRSLTTGYSKYITDIESASNKLNPYFIKRWDHHEKVWRKWSCDDVANWIKYLNQTDCENKICLSNKVDLTVVQQNITEHGICGGTLDQMEKNDWIHIGVQLLDDRRQIHEKIQIMINRYPRDAKECQSLLKNYDLVPEAFKCPINGEIMMDPVRCSDNKTYERHNIIQYIEQHGKLPGSDEDYDAEDSMFKNVGLKRQIQQFLLENPQFRYED